MPLTMIDADDKYARINDLAATLEELGVPPEHGAFECLGNAGSKLGRSRVKLFDDDPDDDGTDEDYATAVNVAEITVRGCLAARERESLEQAARDASASSGIYPQPDVEPPLELEPGGGHGITPHE